MSDGCDSVMQVCNAKWRWRRGGGWRRQLDRGAVLLSLPSEWTGWRERVTFCPKYFPFLFFSSPRDVATVLLICKYLWCQILYIVPWLFMNLCSLRDFYIAANDLCYDWWGSSPSLPHLAACDSFTADWHPLSKFTRAFTRLFCLCFPR